VHYHNLGVEQPYPGLNGKGFARMNSAHLL
jgi:hypothetical protein